MYRLPVFLGTWLLPAAVLAAVSPTVQPGAAGSVVGSQTVYNQLATPTPPNAVDTTFPKLLPQAFAPGLVPQGDIAVPRVGGRPIRYQADKRLYWPDGSLKYAVFANWMPRLAGQTAEQVNYVLQPGTYDNTPGTSLASLKAVSNYSVQLTGEAELAISNGNNALPPYTVIDLTVSGGQLTAAAPTHGGALGYNCGNSNGGCGTVTPRIIAPGATTAPAIEVAFDPATKQASRVTVTNPGAGIITDGSGNFQCSFHNMPASAISRTASGPGFVEFDAFGPFTDRSNGAPHSWLACHIIVGAFLNADGSVYGTRATAIVTNGLYKQHGVIPPLSYSASFMNGSKCIRGACAGAALYRGIAHTTQGAWLTADQNVQVDNSVNDAALKAVVIAPTSADEAFMKASGLIPPYDDSARTAARVSPQVLSITGSQNMANDECSYYPFNFGCTDGTVGWGSAGTHLFLGALPLNAAIHYLVAPINRAGGITWLQNVREAAASAMHVLGGSIEPATGAAVNIVSASQFPTLPYRPNASSRIGIDMSSTGPGSQQQGNTPNSWVDWGHLGEYETYAILTDGEQWEFDALQLAASMAESMGTVASRDQTLSGSPYNKTFKGLTVDSTGNGIREAAWAGEAVAEAAILLPSYFQDQPYFSFLMYQNYTFMRDITEEVGTVASGNGTVDKRFSYSLIGYIDQSDQLPHSGTAPQAQFMRGYHAQDLLYQTKQLNHASADLDVLIQYEVANAFFGYSSDPCPYNDVSYVIWPFQYLSTLQPLASWADRFYFDQRSDLNVATTPGSGEIAAIRPASFDYPLKSGIPWKDGTLITPVNMSSPQETAPNPANVGPWPPPPSAENVAYYYHPIDAMHGTVWLDKAETQPLVFTAATRSEWGVKPAGGCASLLPGYATANWENPGGAGGADSRQAEIRSVAEDYEAVFGDNPQADTIIANTSNFYPDHVIPYWLTKSYTPGPTQGPTSSARNRGRGPIR